MNLNLKKYLNNHSSGYVIDIYYKGKHREFVCGNKEVIPEVLANDTNTLYDVASLTKTYTATLVYIAVEEKKLELSDFVRNIDDRFVNLDSVKVIDLLCHNQEIWTDGYLGNAKSEEEFYQILFSAKVKSDFPTYVDVHYIILSTLLEHIYGKRYDIILQEKILDKLHLSDTTVYPKGNNIASNNYENVGDQVVDYILPGYIHDTKARVAKNLGIITGHASIFTTGSDLLKFLMSFLDCSLLKKETIKQMLKHYNIEQLNEHILNNIVNEDKINKMYERALIKEPNVRLARTYNFMGARYHNPIDALNDVPLDCSKDTIVFSGYTGPMYVVDFKREIIVVIMCNVIHNTTLNRAERKKITEELMNFIVKNIEEIVEFDIERKGIA